MPICKTALLTTALTVALTAAAFAQEAAHDMSAMGSILPEICTSSAMPAAEMAPMAMDHAMDEAHTALMAGMDAMNQDMMTGAMAQDIDIAFVCGMIPHHQGAISMAKAELQYGDSDWAKAMAQKVIDAQEAEIAEMLAWLAEQPAE